MRALRVVGLEEDGETVVCEDPDNGERFSVPADERLRAAARGDLTRLGQVQIEMEAQMRPREIQARIRGGASVEQVAESAGIPEQRVERYAYPVLLERTQTAEKAQRAHPVREDGPDVQTLGEVVAHTFGMRGHDYSETTWDSWRGEDGKWVVQLRWHAGRSENEANWVFHPGAHGGTVSALDDHAADLLDPSPNRPLRTVRPVTELAREALELEKDEEEDAAPEQEPSPREAPVQGPAPAPPAPVLGQPVLGQSVLGQRGTSVPPVGEPASRSARQAAQTVADTAESHQYDAGDGDALFAADPPATDTEAYPDDDEAARTESGQRKSRKNHPIVPSWEDVLLGVRSHR